MFETIKPYLPEIVTFIAGLSAWGYERNKRKLDIKQHETSNNKQIMDLYQEALDDLKRRYDSDIKELEAKYDLKFKEMELRYNKLKTAFDNYKRLNKK